MESYHCNKKRKEKRQSGRFQNFEGAESKTHHCYTYYQRGQNKQKEFFFLHPNITFYTSY